MYLSVKQKEEIVNLIIENKDQSDMEAVYTVIADTYNCAVSTVRKIYGDYTRKQSGQASFDFKPANLVQKFKAIVKERDNYKESSQLYKEQRDELQRNYNAMKSDYEKMVRDFQELEEILK
jgi:hypothetical protein